MGYVEFTRALALQTLANGDKLTVTVERIDGGKLRCTGATWSDASTGASSDAPARWSDAVVIYLGEALALLNIERQVLPSAPRLRGCGTDPPPTPRSRDDDFEALIRAKFSPSKTSSAKRMPSAPTLPRGCGTHLRDVVRRRGDFSGRSFRLPKHRAPSATASAT
jgi:hypothetical protein